jgi:uncharacterized protein involved in outer membrane biogenesis
MSMKQLLQLLKPLGIIQSGTGRLVIDVNTVGSGNNNSRYSKYSEYYDKPNEYRWSKRIGYAI